MASLNKVQLIGNLGKDPEMRSFPNGDQVAALSLATTSRWKDKESGQPQEATEWHRVTFKGRLAEICEEFLKKGAHIYVEGALRTRKFADKDGVERYMTEVHGTALQMLDRREAGSSSPGFDGSAEDDDVPF